MSTRSPSHDVRASFPRYGGIDGGLQTPSQETLPQPSRFSGQPTDRAKHFISRVSVIAKAEYATVRDRIIFTSLYLDGCALDWFMCLLGRNTNVYLPVETARRRLGERQLMIDRADTFGLTTLPFVLAELSSYSTFLDALLAKFPDRHS